MPDRVERALERAERAETLTLIQLEALPFEDARDLLRAAHDDPDASLIYAESGGNPFSSSNWHGRSGGEGAAERAAAGGRLAGIEVPPAVAAALTEELAELGDEIRLLLQAAAVVGDPFEPELAAAAAAIDEEAALGALDLLLARDIIRETDVPASVPVQASTRQACGVRVGTRRVASHGAPALRGALASRGAPVAARAAPRRAVGEARRCVRRRCASRSRRGCCRIPHRQRAARWFEGALRLVSEDAPAEERVALAAAQARALAATGQYTESHAALLESIRLVPDEAVAVRMRLITQCAVVEHQLGRYDDARVRLESALAGSDDEHSREAVGVDARSSDQPALQADFDGMHAWAARARRGRALGDRVLTATALTIRQPVQRCPALP